jgi:hypothetical protein
MYRQCLPIWNFSNWKKLRKAPPARIGTVRDKFGSLTLGPGSRRSLTARGQFLNTSAGVGFCSAFSLLAAGTYLIQQQFANPVEAQSAELVFSALLSPRRSRCFIACCTPQENGGIASPVGLRLFLGERKELR